MSTAKGPRRPQMGRRAHDSMAEMVDSGGVRGILERRDCMSRTVVRKRYTAVRVALAKR
jgi:hypothetical protein